MPFTNPKDPMLKSGPEVERHLFDEFNKLASGYEFQFVVGAAMNLLVNAIRQNCATRMIAEKMFDELLGRTKNLLLEKHYDAVSGKRRNVFPHTQIIEAQLVHFDDKANG